VRGDGPPAVRLLQEYGFAAERVPLSGAARGRFGGDVSAPLLGVDRRVEVKCRADGFREIYKWLDGADVLVCALNAANHWWSCRRNSLLRLRRLLNATKNSCASRVTRRVIRHIRRTVSHE
jgi:hypothetical protein